MGRYVKKDTRVSAERPYQIPFEDWMGHEFSDQRPCYEKTDWFFADEPEDDCLELARAPRQELVKLAVSLCFDCPFRDRCLEVAMSNTQISGIWGGTTQAERKCLKGVCVKHVRCKARRARNAA